MQKKTADSVTIRSLLRRQTSMKMYLLLLTASLSMTVAHSQNYKSLFGSSSTDWTIIPFGACDNICSGLYNVSGDTVVNSKSYKVIPNLGFIREDTVLGKAWFYKTNTFFNKEYLIMDLGLNLNDTFFIYDLLDVPFAFKVDSIYFVNSLKHIRLNGWISMCALNEKITFIEGSGTNASFHYQRQLNGNSVPTYMLCHYKNGVKVSGNFIFNDSCNVCELGINENIFHSDNFADSRAFAKRFVDSVQFRWADS